MNTAELLTWINEVTALWWLIPAALSFICLRRRLQRHTGFTDQGWFLLFGHSRNEVSRCACCSDLQPSGSP